MLSDRAKYWLQQYASGQRIPMSVSEALIAFGLVYSCGYISAVTVSAEDRFAAMRAAINLGNAARSPSFPAQMPERRDGDSHDFPWLNTVTDYAWGLYAAGFAVARVVLPMEIAAEPSAPGTLMAAYCNLQSQWLGDIALGLVCLPPQRPGQRHSSRLRPLLLASHGVCPFAHCAPVPDGAMYGYCRQICALLTLSGAQQIYWLQATDAWNL